MDTPSQWIACIWVGCGGFGGAIARYLVALLVNKKFAGNWPLATFVINVTGCLVLGAFVTYTSEKLVVDQRYVLLFPVGFVGAYTTFSTYEFELQRLVSVGEWGKALSYCLASTVIGFLAVILGTELARKLG